MTEVYRRQIDILGRLGYIRGMSPWILYDFRAEKRMNRYQRGWTRKGLIARDKAPKKDASAVLSGHCHRLIGGRGRMNGRAALGRRYLSVAATLRERLDGARWQPAERQLSEDLDTPCATIHEALIVPEVEGRVQVRRMSGVYALPKTLPETAAPVAAPVADIGPFELLRARQVVESAIAAAAALAVTDSQIADMRRGLALEVADIAEGCGSCAGGDAVHRLAAEATQHEALVATSEGLWSIWSSSPLWSRIHVRIFDQTCRTQWSHDHREVLRGPERRDSASARDAMWQHLGNVSDTLLHLSDPDISVPAKAVGRRRALRSMP